MIQLWKGVMLFHVMQVEMSSVCNVAVICCFSLCTQEKIQVQTMCDQYNSVERRYICE